MGKKVLHHRRTASGSSAAVRAEAGSSAGRRTEGREDGRMSSRSSSVGSEQELLLMDTTISQAARLANSGRRPVVSHAHVSSSTLLSSVDDSSYYFRLFNARNAKLIAVLSLTVIAVYHLLLRVAFFGQDSCLGLLQEGRYQGNRVWQPYGCMLHSYTQTDARICMDRLVRLQLTQSNRIVFIGDFRIRQMFTHFVSRLSSDYVDASIIERGCNERGHFEYVDHALQMNLQLYCHDEIDSAFLDSVRSVVDVSIRRPDLIVLSAALMTINRTHSLPAAMKSAALNEYTKNISLLLPHLQRLKSKAPNVTVLWFVQPSVDRRRAPTEYGITADMIAVYNREAYAVLASSSVEQWYSGAMLSDAFASDSRDGISLGPVALEFDTQILLNHYCNDAVRHSDGTCCSGLEAQTALQICAFGLFGLCIFITSLVLALRVRFHGIASLVENGVDAVGYDKASVSVRLGTAQHRSAVFTALSKLFALCLLFYICDRANFFMKENRWFTYYNLFLPIGYLSVVGLFFNEPTKRSKFLHRSLINELKGWAILALLCSKMTGAEQNVQWLNLATRCLVSIFLFLNGYSHFAYLWSTGNFSLAHFLQRLLQFNLVTVSMCVTMNRTYQFYEMAPMLTFWFVVVFAAFAVPPRVSCSGSSHSRNLVVMSCKLIFLGVIISLLYSSQVLFENVFRAPPWQAFFVDSDGSVRQWWTRWSIDRYTTLLGMCVAFAVILARRFLRMNDADGGNLFSRRISIGCAVCAVIGFTTYAFLLGHCGTLLDCSELHPYIVGVPIVSYITLRNVFGSVRMRISTFLSWFGSIALELYTVHFHFWLAADGQGVLVLLPRLPVFNVILTSYLFGCAAHELRLITDTLAGFLAPDDGKDSRVAIRNFVVLLLLYTGTKTIDAVLS